MALITNNISGSSSDSWKISVTGSIAIANPGAAGDTTSNPYAFPGVDVGFFVSGSRGGRNGTKRVISAFGGDVVISGSIAAQDGIGGFSPVKILTDAIMTGSMVLSASATPLAPSSTESAIYVKTVAGLPQLYAKNGSASEFAIAASAASSGIQGAVQFSNGASGFSSDANNFFWDSTNGILKVSNLQVTGSTFVVTSTNVTISDPVVLIGSGTKSNNSKSIIAFASGTNTGPNSVVFGPTGDGTDGISAAQLDVLDGTLPYTSIDLAKLVPVRASKFEVGGALTAITSSDAQTITVSGSQGIVLQHAAIASNGAVAFKSDKSTYFAASRDGSNNSVLDSKSNIAVFSGSQIQLLASGTTGNANIVVGVSSANTFLQIQSGSAGLPGVKVESINNNDLTIQAPANQTLFLAGNNQVVAKVGSVTIDAVARQGLFPTGDKQQWLGGPSNRWANIYTGDLHLKNERGDYTLIEEEDFLSIRFNKTGKRYKFVLEPVPELDEK